MGRLKTALLTFLPPIVGGLLWPNGFCTPLAMPAGGNHLGGDCAGAAGAHRVNASVAQIPRLGRQADDCADPGVRRR
jgi:hypothetical protein